MFDRYTRVGTWSSIDSAKYLVCRILKMVVSILNVTRARHGNQWSLAGTGFNWSREYAGIPVTTRLAACRLLAAALPLTALSSVALPRPIVPPAINAGCLIGCLFLLSHLPPCMPIAPCRLAALQFSACRLLVAVLPLSVLLLASLPLAVCRLPFSAYSLAAFQLIASPLLPAALPPVALHTATCRFVICRLNGLPPCRASVTLSLAVCGFRLAV